MATMYYVELGRFVWDTDDEWQGFGESDWQLPIATMRDLGYYSDLRYWKFDQGDATADVMDFFGIDFIEDVDQSLLERAYGIITRCEVPDLYADMLSDGESVAPTGEQYVSYDHDDVVIACCKHGSMAHIEY